MSESRRATLLSLWGWPVVLGVSLRGKDDLAGALPPPVFDTKALGGVFLTWA